MQSMQQLEQKYIIHAPEEAMTRKRGKTSSFLTLLWPRVVKNALRAAMRQQTSADKWILVPWHGPLSSACYAVVLSRSVL